MKDEKPEASPLECVLVAIAVVVIAANAIVFALFVGDLIATLTS